jgi:hypothetical protein
MGNTGRPIKKDSAAYVRVVDSETASLMEVLVPYKGKGIDNVNGAKGDALGNYLIFFLISTCMLLSILQHVPSITSHVLLLLGDKFVEVDEIDVRSPWKQACLHVKAGEIWGREKGTKFLHALEATDTYGQTKIPLFDILEIMKEKKYSSYFISNQYLYNEKVVKW